MIRVQCPKCQAKLNAKDSLAGQVRRCPSCGAEIRIPDLKPADHRDSIPVPDLFGETSDSESGPQTEVSSGGAQDFGQPIPGDAAVEATASEHSDASVHPTKLDRANRYVIVDDHRVVATWQDDGRGWLVQTGSGFTPASRSATSIPNEGRFVLVELTLASDDEGITIAGLRAYRLRRKYALVSLPQGDEAILSKIEGLGRLDRRQKLAVRGYTREKFMYEVWGRSDAVNDYLASVDYHSSGVPPLPS